MNEAHEMTTGTTHDGGQVPWFGLAPGSEAWVRSVHDWSVAAYGPEHTHDFECMTWRGHNYVGGCDCSLSERTPAASSPGVEK